MQTRCPQKSSVAAHLRNGAGLPHCTRGPARQDAGPEVALLGGGGRVVSAGVEDLDGGPAGHAAGVRNRRPPGRAPGVELVDVLLGAGRRALVRGPVPADIFISSAYSKSITRSERMLDFGMHEQTDLIEL